MFSYEMYMLRKNIHFILYKLVYHKSDNTPVTPPLPPLAEVKEWAASAIPESKEFCFTCLAIIFALLELLFSAAKMLVSTLSDTGEKLVPSTSVFPLSLVVACRKIFFECINLSWVYTNF